MSDLWSSAWSYLSGGGSEGSAGSRFVGQTVDLGGDNKLRVKKVIAEGGYGFVFIAQDLKTGKEYALKRQVVSKENVKAIKQEIAFLKQLSDHPHIVQFIAAAGCPPSQTSHGSAEFVIETELCTGGLMEDIVKTVQLTPRQVLRVFFETCCAVAHMHSQNPPIIHRDLKVENLLLNSEGKIKLCDFGSATTKQLHPDHSWTATQRGLSEDEIQRNTTPMYRSPEMIDLYSNHPVNEKADIWALGCLLFKLCYKEHPFEDSAKLRILNANFKIPPEDTTYAPFHGIIRSCLVVDPRKRPSVDFITAQLYSIADHLGENLDQIASEPLITVSKEVSSFQIETPTNGETDGSSGMSAALQSTSQQAQKLFGFMKEGAGSLFKNIRESSSKIATMASGTQRTSLDIFYITSRILAMSFPHEDSGHTNNIEEVGAFLDSHHPSQYLVFNLSGNSYDTSKLSNQVADFDWPQRCMPEVEKLVDLCRSLDSWLRADPKNVIVVHCQDGRSITSVAVAAYLLFLGAFRSPTIPYKLFNLKLNPDSPPIMGAPSQLRYLQYISDLVGVTPYKPHTYSVSLHMIKLSTVPLFNAIKTGCKPFVEVFQEGERVFTSATHDTMEKIRSFSSDDRGVEIPIDVTVRGNVMVILHHIRAIPVARKVGMGMTAIRMFQFQLHTGFLSPNSTSFVLERHEIDSPTSRKQDKFPSPFQVIVELEVNRSGAPTNGSSAASWQNLPHPRASPLTCYSSRIEEEEMLKQFGELDRSLAANRQKPISPQAVHVHLSQDVPSTNHAEESTSAGSNHLAGRVENPREFFSQLNWQGGEEAGYVPFQDQDESSSSESEEELQSRSQQADPFKGQETRGGTGIEMFANFDAAFGGGGQKDSRVAGVETSETKLIEFSFSEKDQPAEGAPQQTQQREATRKSSGAIFGNFDPWKASEKGSIETGDILGFGDSDELSQVSMASEARTVGAETFKSRPPQFDPFGPTTGSGDTVFDLLGGSPLHPMPASAGVKTNPAISTPTDVPLNPNLLNPFQNPPATSKRSYSVPTVTTRPPIKNFTPTFGVATPETTSKYTTSSFGTITSSHSQSNLSSYGSNWGSSKSGRNPPYTTSSHHASPRTSPVPFGNLSSSTGNLPQATLQNKPQGRFDPFADLGNITGMPKPPQSTTPSTTSSTSSSNRSSFQPMTSRPVYNYQRYSQQPSSQSTQLKSTQSQGRAPSPKPPNYVIGGRAERGPRPKTGLRPNLGENQFGDLLNAQGFASTREKGPKSLKDMKKRSESGQAVDPDRARVADWAEGKERNIRALLSSLHTILWDGETRWNEVGMHQLVQPDQVKRFFRKACLSVHPDKAQETTHETLARAIFDELNEAYTKFEESGAKPLF